MRCRQAGGASVVAMHADVGLDLVRAAAVLECNRLYAGLTSRERAAGVASEDHAFDPMLGGRRYEVGYLVAVAAAYIDPRRRHQTCSWVAAPPLVGNAIRPPAASASGGESARLKSMAADRSRRTSRTFAAGSAAMKMFRPAASPRAPLAITSATKVPNWWSETWAPPAASMGI